MSAFGGCLLKSDHLWLCIIIHTYGMLQAEAPNLESQEERDAYAVSAIQSVCVCVRVCVRVCLTVKMPWESACY
jgi:hypothetical protein